MDPARKIELLKMLLMLEINRSKLYELEVGKLARVIGSRAGEINRLLNPTPPLIRADLIEIFLDLFTELAEAKQKSAINIRKKAGIPGPLFTRGSDDRGPGSGTPMDPSFM